MTKKYFITGSAGQLGKEFVRYFRENKISFSAPSESECNITDFDRVRALIKNENPEVILNCAAYNAVDQAEEDQEKAFLINADAVKNLALVAKEINALFIHYSTDYVFDGASLSPYTEESAPNPLNVYGKSKRAGEVLVQEIGGDFLIFRTSWVYGEGTQNFLSKLAGWAEKNAVLSITSDEISVPTSTLTLVRLTLSAVEKNLRSLYHLTNSGSASRFKVAQEYCRLKGLQNTLTECSIDEFNTAAIRPKNSAMSNAKLARDLGVSIPSWQDALKEFLARQDANGHE
jgi:dTDP-4-dehydrorhamnose reductase